MLRQEAGLAAEQEWVQDMHEPHVVAALTRLCTASLLVKPFEGLQREVTALSRGKLGGPHGQLQLHLKRQTGRVHVEAELYSLRLDGTLDTFPLPQEAITAQLLAAHAVQTAGQHLLGRPLFWASATHVITATAGHPSCSQCKPQLAMKRLVQQEDSSHVLHILRITCYIVAASFGCIGLQELEHGLYCAYWHHCS